MNKRLIVILGTLVVAAGIGFIALRGYPPQQGVEGAIGAANRYSETQITDADVTLGDADIQAFLQSDLFHRMQTDADFRQQVLDNRSVLSDGGFIRAIDPLLSSELDAIRSVSMDGAFWSVVDAQTVRALRLDAMSSTLDALSEISDAAMSQIAEDHLPQYFPANNRVAPSDAWVSDLSDGARRLIGDKAFWGSIDANTWSALVVAAYTGRLDALLGKSDRLDMNAAEMDALARKTGLDMNAAKMDALTRKIAGLDMSAAQLDAMREISDAAVSTIADAHLSRYFPGDNQLVISDGWASRLSDGARSLIADKAFWGSIGVDGWKVIADAGFAEKLDGLAELVDAHGFQLDEAGFSLDAMQVIADGHRTTLSLDAQRMLADELVRKIAVDQAQALVDASIASELDAFAMKLDEARVQMDAGTFKMDAFTGRLDGQVWRSMDAAKWSTLDAMKQRIDDYAMVLSTDGFATMVASDNFANRIGDAAYVSALSSADFWSVMSDEQFSSAIADARWSSFIGTDQFGSALADEARGRARR